MAKLTIQNAHILDPINGLDEIQTVSFDYDGEEKTIDLSAASVTPEIKGTPFAKYVITNLTGKADSKYLTITFTCAGAFDVNYQGRLIIEK